MTATSPVKALCLMSGGLDSILAARILMEQHIHVVALIFTTPFFPPDKGLAAARQLGIPERIEDIIGQYLEMMKAPRYGFGNNMNPCIDCHTMMVNIAGQIMEKEKYDFIASGEVIGERPMSQNRQSMKHVAQNSGYADYLLRPLSAKLLQETKPEREGKVNRELLYDISGRSRKPQLELAATFGIKDFPQPAGGCLLTVPSYSARLRELLDHNPNPSSRELVLLNHGRHFRSPRGAKILIGRNNADNEQIIAHATKKDILIFLEPLKGPVGFLSDHDPENIQLTVSLCVFFSKYRNQDITLSVDIDGQKQHYQPAPLTWEFIEKHRIQ